VAEPVRVVAPEATSRPPELGHETPQLRLEQRLLDGSRYRINMLLCAGPEEAGEDLGFSQLPAGGRPRRELSQSQMSLVLPRLPLDQRRRSRPERWWHDDPFQRKRSKMRWGSYSGNSDRAAESLIELRQGIDPRFLP